MEQFKRLLRKLFFPKMWMTLLSIPVSAVLLIYTFAGGHKEDWIAIPAYIFSAYSLSLVCVRVGLLVGHTKEDVQSIIDKVPLAHRYFSDVSFKLHISLYLSLGLNVIYAVMKFTFGLRYHSVWFGTLAVYYFLLAVMRFLLLHHANRKGFGTDRIGELQSYRLCGMILMVMNISLTGVVVLVIRKNEGFQYASYLIYIMAMYAFYNIITAVMNVVKYRKYRSPVMSAAKVVSLAAALVSMLSLETAMLTQFGSTDSEMSRRIMTACTGAGICTMILAMAVYMIYHATRELKCARTEEEK